MPQNFELFFVDDMKDEPFLDGYLKNPNTFLQKGDLSIRGDFHPMVEHFWNNNKKSNPDVEMGLINLLELKCPQILKNPS